MTGATDAGHDGHLVHALREVETARLAPDDWPTVERLLARLEAGEDVVAELTTVVFEAKVRTRFSGRRTDGGIPPTKQTSVLPLVGVVCGGLLFGVGALLGGGVILAGIAALGVFVFGIAFAGSRVAHRDHDPASDDDPLPPPVPPPAEVTRRIARLRA